MIETWRELYRQRLRWKRGALEKLSDYPLTRVTARYWGRRRFTPAGIERDPRVSRLARLMHCRARLGAPAPVWLAVTTIFVAERVVTVRARGPLQMALAAALRVEMPFDRFLQVVHAKANPRHVDKQRKEVVSMYHKAVLARTGAAAATYPAATRSEVEGTESLVSLQYPNGRIHETALIRARELRVGDQFELHGRQWRAIESKQNRGRTTKLRPRVLCVLASLPAQP